MTLSSEVTTRRLDFPLSFWIPVWALFFFDISASFGSIQARDSLFPNTVRIRIEKKIATVLDRFHLNVNLVVDQDPLRTTVSDSLLILCKSQWKGCRIENLGKGRSLGLDFEDENDIVDVSTRGFHSHGIVTAAERSIYVLYNRLLTETPPPWRRASFLSMLMDSEVILPRDNLQVGLFMVDYITDHIRNLKEYPRWFYTQGSGVWFEPFHINFHLTTPYRMLGYFLAYMTDLDSKAIYKIGVLFLGVPILLLGIYLLGLEFLKSRAWAVTAVLATLFSSVFMSFLHAEQLLGSLLYIPYLWLFLIKLKKNPRFIFPLVILFGMSLTVHYPHITIGYSIILFLGSALCFSHFKVHLLDTVRRLKNYLTTKRLFLLGLAGFLSIAPSIYSLAKFQGNLTSPFRNKNLFESMSYEDYETAYKGSIGGIDKRVFGIFLGLKSPSEVPGEDLRSILWNAVIPFALLMMVFTPFRGRSFLLITTLLCAGFSMGSQTIIPRILFYTIPLFSMFRVWNSFIVFFDLHLLFLTLATIQAFFIRFPYRRRLGLSLMIAIAIGSSVPWLHQSWERYQWLISRNTLDYYSLTAPSTFTERVLYDENLAFKGAREFFSPRGIDLDQIKLVSKQAPAHWISKSGVVLQVDQLQHRVSPDKGGFKYHLPNRPKEAVAFLVHQYNDGNWMAKDQKGKELLISTTPLKTLQISPELETVDIFLSRRFTIFPYLLLGMWLPLVCYLAYEALLTLRKFRLTNSADPGFQTYALAPE